MVQSAGDLAQSARLQCANRYLRNGLHYGRAVHDATALPRAVRAGPDDADMQSARYSYSPELAKWLQARWATRLQIPSISPAKLEYADTECK